MKSKMTFREKLEEIIEKSDTMDECLDQIISLILEDVVGEDEKDKNDERTGLPPRYIFSINEGKNQLRQELREKVRKK